MLFFDIICCITLRTWQIWIVCWEWKQGREEVEQDMLRRTRAGTIIPDENIYIKITIIVRVNEH